MGYPCDHDFVDTKQCIKCGAEQPVAREGLEAELRKHQDLVEALQFLPAGTVVDFADLDDFLEEMRDAPTCWLPRRECQHEHFEEAQRHVFLCKRCGTDRDELPPAPVEKASKL